MEQEQLGVNQSYTSVGKTSISILCCMCGLKFNPAESRTNICIKCLSNQNDATEGITKTAILNFCRMCKRYNRPPWSYCERESRELLALCLKKIKGLNKVKIVEAAFVWTEPHSRRIKVKLTVQTEVMNNTSIQQSFVVEFFEHYMQCDDCKKEFTPHTWGAMVQLRQKVTHKKTFLFLEQMILKHNIHEKVLKVENDEGGLNFYYKNKGHAQRLVDFMQGTVPTRIKPSRQLLSTDEQNAILNYKFSFSIEIPKICKEDLVIIPKRLCKELGGCGQLLFCYKITSNIHFIDPCSLKRIDMNATQYFHYEPEITILSIKNNATEYLVCDCEKVHNQNLNESFISSVSNIFLDKIVECEVMRLSDCVNFKIKTHLAGQVKVGATIIGYDLTKLTVEELEDIKNKPDLILVKRIYPERQSKKRIWKLRRLEKDGVMMEEKGGKGKSKKKGGDDEDKDMEELMEDIEHDRDLREKINLYRDEEQIKKLSEKDLQKRRNKTSRKQKFKDRKVIKINVTKQKEEENLKKNIHELDKDLKNKLNDKPNLENNEDDEFEDVEDEDEDDVDLDELMEDLTLNENQKDATDSQINQQLADEFIDENMDEFVEQFVKSIDKVKVEIDTKKK